MSQNDTKIVSRKLGAFLLVAGLVAFTFNNCGGSHSPSERAFVPQQQLQNAMSNLYSGKLSSDVCRDASQYVCVHKIFSQDVEDAQSEIDFPCVKVSDGTEICVLGDQYRYNSSAAVASCGENCSESYEYQEFNCYVRLPDVHGVYPIQFTAENFQVTVDETYRACLRVVGGTK